MNRLLLVLTLLVFRVPAPMVRATVDNSQTEITNTLCVVDVTGLPIPVQFQNSIRLTQAVKRAGIVREDIKNRVLIFSRLQDNSIQLTKLNLKRIENGATDFELDQHDIVFVEPKTKHSLADDESVWRSCEICGCKPMFLMHGRSVPVPKEWTASDAPAENYPTPNNQKP